MYIVSVKEDGVWIRVQLGCFDMADSLYFWAKKKGMEVAWSEGRDIRRNDFEVAMAGEIVADWHRDEGHKYF